MNGIHKDGNNDFGRAVLLAYDQAIDPEHKHAAIQYCDAIKASSEGWRVCVEQLHYTCVNDLRDEIKFFCLSTLLYHIQQRYDTVYSESDRSAIRSALMILIRDVLSTHVQPSFIKNKLCAVLVQIVKYDYTTRWPTFFSDFTSLLNPNSVEIVDLFIRLLRVLDDEVVVVDDRRNETEVLQNTAIKDNMRANDLSTIVNAIMWTISTFNNTRPSLAASCLDCLAEYVGWIDIHFTVHQQMLSMLYQCLLQSTTQLQAAHCLCEIVDKRMDSTKKIALIRDIQLIDVMYKLDLNAASNKFSRRIAQLISATGEQLCACITDLAKAGNQAALCAEATAMLERVMSIAYTLMQLNRWKSTRSLIDLLTSYTFLYKTKQLSVDTLAHHYQRIFLLIVQTIEFQPWYDFDSPDDKEAAYTEYRSLLTKLFTNLARTSPNDLICIAVANELNTVFNENTDILTVPFARLEALLKLHYTLGEAIQKSALTRIIDPNDIMAQMTYKVLCSNVSQYPHTVIQTRWFELVHRYGKIMEHKQHLVVPLITTFIDQRGIRNSSAVVAARASYLLLRTVLQMTDGVKQQLRPIIINILTSVQAAVQPVLTLAQHGTKHTLSGDECNFLCECMGAVTTSVVVGVDQCVTCTHSITSYFTEQLQAAIQASHTVQHNTLQYEQLQECVCNIVEAYACYTKPLTKEGGKLTEIWMQAVGVMSTVLQVFKDSESIYSKVIVFLHRMIDCIREPLLLTLPPLLTILLQHTTNISMVIFIQLLGQLVTAYKKQVEQVLDAIMSPFLQRYLSTLSQYSVINNDVPVAIQAIQDSERQTLIRTILTFFRQVVTHDLLHVITVSQRNEATVPALLQMLARSASDSDPTICKACYWMLQQLLPHLMTRINAQQSDSAHYKQLLYHDITVQQFNTMFNTKTDFKMASYDALLREICELQASTARVFGTEYTAYFRQMLSNQPALAGRPEFADEYVRLMRLEDNGVQLRKYASQLIVARRSSKPLRIVGSP